MDRPLNLSFGQLNAGCGRAATALLSSDAMLSRFDIILIQEPYHYLGEAVGFSGIFTAVFAPNPKAAIFLGPSVEYNIIFNNQYINAVLLDGYNTLIINVYFPPSLDLVDFLNCLSQIVSNNSSTKCIISGDFNAKHSLWGGPVTDDRGTELLNFIDNFGFEVVNDACSPPTFNCNRGISWIDITLTRGIGDALQNWSVEDRITGSDHCLLSFSLLGSPPVPPKSRSYDLSKVRNWLMVKHSLYSSFAALSFRDLPGNDLDSRVVSLSDRVIGCFPSSSGTGLGRKDVGRSSPWWTPSLAAQRSRVRAMRRRYQREGDRDIRARQRCCYGRALALYKKAVLKAKRDSWNTFLSKISANDPIRSWDYLVTDKVDSRLRYRIEHPDHGIAGNVSESIRFLLDFHFPVVVDPLPDLAGLSCVVPPVTRAEVALCFSESRRGTTPGPDGIAINVWEEIFQINSGLLIDLFNACLVSGIFPGPWLTARVIFFSKFGKDPTQPSSYRPICLLNTLGKLLERVIAGRINYYLSENGFVSYSQYGFARGSSTIQAIDRVCEFIGDSRPGSHVSLIALDVKNAFNSLRWSLVIRELIRLRVPGYLIRIIRAYFSDRRVFSDLVGDFVREYNVGAPQGSILAPILWNLVLNPLLDLNSDEEIDLIAYADDILVMIRGTSTPGVALRANDILDRVFAWCESNFLTLDTDKSSHMFFPKSGTSAASPPRVFLNGISLRRSYNLKYLGVFFDINLSWTFHLNSLYARTQILYHRLLRISGKTWGLTPAVRKKLYLVKIAPMILYGSQVWWRWGGNVRMKNLLNKIQRPFLLLITRSYRTVSTSALQVMAGVPPLYLIAEQRTAIYGLTLGNNISYGMVDIDYAHFEAPLSRHYLDPLSASCISWSVYNHHHADILIFTDGSRLDDRVGAGFVSFLPNCDKPLFSHQCRLSDHASVFQAEVLAILHAVHWVTPLTVNSIAIISDSRSALDAICSEYPSTELVCDAHNSISSLDNRVALFWTRSHVGTSGNEAADLLAKSATRASSVDFTVGISLSRVKTMLWKELVNRWNSDWRRGDVGRPVFEIWPSVGLGLRIGDFYLAQVATGHGKFPSYYNQFWNRGNSCRCGVEDADRNHYIFDCPILDDLRNRVLPSLARGRPDLSQLFKFRSTSRGLAAIMSYLVSHEETLFVT